MGENRTTLRIILAVAAGLLFLFGAGFPFPAASEGYRLRIVSAGLALWVASTFF